jgi:hypothetical protein
LYAFCVFYQIFTNFHENSCVVGVHTVLGICVAVGVPADASNVVGVSTVADILAAVGLLSAVDVCDVSI